MWGQTYTTKDRDQDEIYAKAGRRLLAGTPLNDIVELPRLEHKIGQLELDIRILQKEVADLQKSMRHLLPDKLDDV